MSTFKTCTILLQVFSALLSLESVQCPTVSRGRGIKNVFIRRNISQAPDKEDFTTMSDIELALTLSNDDSPDTSLLTTLVPAVMIGGMVLFLALVGFVMIRLFVSRPRANAPREGGTGPLPPLGAVKALARARRPRAANDAAAGDRAANGAAPRERSSWADPPNKKRKTEKPRDDDCTRKKLKVEQSKGRKASDSKLVLHENTCDELSPAQSEGDDDCKGTEPGKDNMKYLSQIKEELGHTRMELNELKNKHESVRSQVSDLVSKIKNIQDIKTEIIFQSDSPTYSDSSVLTEIELRMEKFLKDARNYRPACDESNYENDLERAERFSDSRADTWSPEDLSKCVISNWSGITNSISERCVSEKQDDSTYLFSESEVNNKKENSLYEALKSPDRSSITNKVLINDVKNKCDFKDDIMHVNCSEIEECISTETVNTFDTDFDNSGQSLDHIINKGDIYGLFDEPFLNNIPNIFLVQKFELDSAPPGNDISIDAKTVVCGELQNKISESSLSEENVSLEPSLTDNEESSLECKKWRRHGRARSEPSQTTKLAIKEGRPVGERKNEDETFLQRIHPRCAKGSPAPTCAHRPSGAERARAKAGGQAASHARATAAAVENVRSLNTGLRLLDTANHHHCQQIMEKCLPVKFDASAAGNEKTFVSTKLSASEINILDLDLKKLLNEIAFIQCDVLKVGWYVFTLTVYMLKKIFYIGATPDEINVYAKRLDMCGMIIRNIMKPKDIGLHNENESVVDKNLTREQIIYVIQIHWALIKRSKKHYDWLLGGLAAQLEYCFISLYQKEILVKVSALGNKHK